MHSQPRLEPERVDLVRGREPEHRARPEHDIQEQREHEADAAAAVRRHQRARPGACRRRWRRRRSSARTPRAPAGGTRPATPTPRGPRAGSSRRRSCARACRARASSPCASRPRARGRPTGCAARRRACEAKFGRQGVRGVLYASEGRSVVLARGCCVR